ncbi:MAG: Gfo/Idh/MocA family oxidoreductase [Planctomycetota bacterium]|nr:Gfo/Idh/MocA family oxidoreductase [Planctomycetota bacterium]
MTSRSIVVGLGGRGLGWVESIRRRKDCSIVAYVEPHEPNVTRAVERLGIPRDLVFATLPEALKKVKADWVMDVTPPAVHHLVAYDAFNAGLHVLGEKPLSDDYSHARNVVEAGTKAGVRHMITQNYRFTSQPRTTRKLLAEGLLGQLGQCDVQFYMPWADIPGSHYVTQPFMLINDMMVHHFDMIRYVLGTDPVAVQAMTWNQSWGWHKGDAAHAIMFEFANGMHATHVSVGCALGRQTSWNGNWRIEGTGGTITWEDSGMWHTHLHRVEKPFHKQIFPVHVPPPDQAILDEFLASIRDKREPECSAKDNLRSVAMVFAAIKSAKEGRKVKLEEL